MGLAGYSFSDLFEPSRLQKLHADFDLFFQEEEPASYATFDAYRQSCARGETVAPEARSSALLAAAPIVSRFIARLFQVEKEVADFREAVRGREPLWRFKHEFAKKRILRADAGKTWKGLDKDAAEAARVSRVALLSVLGTEGEASARGEVKHDEELAVASGTLLLFEIVDTARKVDKGGGATWTEELRVRARAVGEAFRSSLGTGELVIPSAVLENDASCAAYALDAVEAWLAARHADPRDTAHTWPSLHTPRTLDFANLVQLRRPDPKLPELFVGPEEERRERDSFALTDRRGGAREAEEQIDYCLICHDRDKDSCSKGLPEPKTRVIKKNPLGVPLDGCPLEEKISEMHAMRGGGDTLAALVLVCIDNPMCPGTGHRICNDCMKACIFQKQEPVNIPEIETRVLSEVLALPWGLEIYGLLTRWNPLNVDRPFARPYNGKNVLVVGLGPAGYTLSHHLASEGFGVVAVDGLKLEPLPAHLVGSFDLPPQPVHDYAQLAGELDERILLGFGGVSEYGITVRWDKNFLTVLYLTLARNRSLRMYGGVRFGGTLTLDDAWALGFDHVAIAAGAGKPTVIDIKNNLARGIRAASDFLMALQLTGAYKKSSIANLQVSLPAIVIGGGLTAIDTATELLAYYVIQIEKTLERFELLRRERGEAGEAELLAAFDPEELEILKQHLAHARELQNEKKRALEEGRAPRVQELLTRWGGVSLVYRKTLMESPAYRLNHEEVAKSLEEGVRYLENLSPVEAVLDERGHVRAMKFERKDKSVLELPARTVCIAAGTSPNVTYEREYEGTFQLDARRQFFRGYEASLDPSGKVSLVPASVPKQGFFTSYLGKDEKRVVSFYGDNHPHYAGSVVKAMASAKDGYPHIARLFPETRAQDPADQPERDARRRALFAKLDEELRARVVEVTRLTSNIVEVVVHAPLAARKFQPGQFYRLQNYETFAPVVDSTRLAMEGLALTGAWVDEARGLMGTIVLEMGGSSRLCAALRPGEPIVLMGPTGTPTEIVTGETVLLCGGGLGNAVLFSIARGFKALGSRVLYFAGYKKGEDLFKQDEIERFTDQVIYCTDMGAEITPRRAQDRHFRGNIVQAMRAYGEGTLSEGGKPEIPFSAVNRIIAIGSDRMMAAVKEARHSVLFTLLDPAHRAIASINSPMQCMMKEICAQCLQKHKDPRTGEETVVFSCSNQDQEIDRVDFAHLRERLRANSMQEKLADAWLVRLLKKRPEVLLV